MMEMIEHVKRIFGRYEGCASGSLEMGERDAELARLLSSAAEAESRVGVLEGENERLGTTLIVARRSVVDHAEGGCESCRGSLSRIDTALSTPTPKPSAVEAAREAFTEAARADLDAPTMKTEDALIEAYHALLAAESAGEVPDAE